MENNTKAPRSSLELPSDILVLIAGNVAETSPTPMDDLRRLRASFRAMRAACGQPDVGRRLALERVPAHPHYWHQEGDDESKGWYRMAMERYAAFIANLTSAKNPEAMFRTGINLTLGHPRQRSAEDGEEFLRRAAEEGGHKTAAYVLAVLLYNDGRADDAKKCMRQVEGDTAYVVINKRNMILNTACDRVRGLAVDHVWPLTGFARRRDELLYNKKEHLCPIAECGWRRGWAQWVAFCSEDCRIVHEHERFFAQVRPLR